MSKVELLMTGTEFQIQRRGEDERFIGSKLRVPKGTLRDRAVDVLAPDVLVKRHAGYRNRVLMGPSFRADVWTVLKKVEPEELTVADVARRAACSFATAWQAVQDFKLAQRGGVSRTTGRSSKAVARRGSRCSRCADFALCAPEAACSARDERYTEELAGRFVASRSDNVTEEDAARFHQRLMERAALERRGR